MKILAVDCCLKMTGAALMVIPSLPSLRPPKLGALPSLLPPSLGVLPPLLPPKLGGLWGSDHDKTDTDGVTSYEQYDLGRRQSQELPHMAERLMRKHNLAWNELDYIAITNGPGYFTGIRVGAAYASGLAYASGAKVIPVSSLELLAHSSGLPGKVLVLVYAGHGFVYASCSGHLEAGEYSHAQIYSWLNDNPDAVIISDDPERTGLHDMDIKTVKPDMILLCEIARKNISLAVSPMELKILYYRAPQGMN